MNTAVLMCGMFGLKSIRLQKLGEQNLIAQHAT